MFKSKYYLPEESASIANMFEKGNIAFTYSENSSSYPDAIILPLKGFSDPVSGITWIFKGGVADKKLNFIDGFFRADRDFIPTYTNLYSDDSPTGRLYYTDGYSVNNETTMPGGTEMFSSYRPDEITKSDETVIYAGVIRDHFGHFITDCLTRLWYAVKNTDDKHRIAFVLDPPDFPEFDPFNPEYEIPFIIKLMEMVGISRDRVLVVREPTQFTNVIVPKPSCFFSSRYNSELFYVVYDEIKSKINPKTEKKIYLSRSKYEKQDIFNETYFEKFFEGQGFKVIYPELLDVEEQIAYVMGADEIACTIGTLSLISVFARKKTRLICLLRSHQISYQQYLVNTAMRLDYVYIDVSINLFASMFHLSHSYLIGPTVYWTKFLKDEYGIEDTTDIFDYLDNTNIKLGSLIKLYLSYITDKNIFALTFRYKKFDYVNYFKDLFMSYNPDGYDDMLRAMTINESLLFVERTFTLINNTNRHEKRLKLNKNGSVRTLKGFENEQYEKYWTYFNCRLLFLDEYHQPIIEFSIKEFEPTFKRKEYKGYLLSDPSVSYRLIDRSYFIRYRRKRINILIKLLVDRNKYQKLKKHPDKFFSDSRSRFIRFLGRFYY